MRGAAGAVGAGLSRDRSGRKAPPTPIDRDPIPYFPSFAHCFISATFCAVMLSRPLLFRSPR